MKRLGWILGGVGAAVAIVLATGAFDRIYTKPDTRVVDSLRLANAALAVHEQLLRAQYAELVVDRDYMRRQRDSLKALSDSITARIKRDRTTLVAAPPDSLLRASYGEALKQLDNSIAELARKDEIIRKDSLDRIQSTKVEANLKTQLANLREQQANELRQTVFWHAEYDRLYAAKQPRCGKKCGIIIGVVVTVGVVALTKKADP